MLVLIPEMIGNAREQARPACLKRHYAPLVVMREIGTYEASFSAVITRSPRPQVLNSNS